MLINVSQVLSTQEVNDILMASGSNINSAGQENACMSVEGMDVYLMKEEFSESTTSSGKQSLHMDSVQVCFTLSHTV